MNSHCLKLYRAYSISFNSSKLMLTNFFASWILKDCIKVQEKKKKVVVLCSAILDKTWKKALSRRSRATTAKKCTKKSDARAELLLCQSKPIAFLPFLLPSLSSLLKLPDMNLREGHFTASSHEPGWRGPISPWLIWEISVRFPRWKKAEDTDWRQRVLVRNSRN